MSAGEWCLASSSSSPPSASTSSYRVVAAVSASTSAASAASSSSEGRHYIAVVSGGYSTLPPRLPPLSVRPGATLCARFPTMGVEFDVGFQDNGLVGGVVGGRRDMEEKDKKRQ